MNVVLALVVVVGFAGTIEYLNLPNRARAVGRQSTNALSVLRDDAMSDRKKESALQGHARQLFRLLGVLVGGSTLALGGPLLGVWLLEQVGIGSFWGTLAVLERVDFLVGVTVVGLAAYLLARRYRNS